MQRFLFLVTLLACAGANCPGTGGDGGSGRGSISAVYRAGALEVLLDADEPPLALAATVRVDGTEITGSALLGDAAAGRDLLRQKTTGSSQLRFAVTDSRALRVARQGVVVRIPVAVLPAHVVVDEISAADGEGRTMELTGFDAAPGSAP
ncbi:MAG: hypothetical protein HY904_04765 [Deltaproteobacteria bacterium]|nr:hypothetical protein [Deltaproteobacteria bacterium]